MDLRCQIVEIEKFQYIYIGCRLAGPKKFGIFWYFRNFSPQLTVENIMALSLWFTEQYRAVQGSTKLLYSTVQFKVKKLLECLYYCCKAVMVCRGSLFMPDSNDGTGYKV